MVTEKRKEFLKRVNNCVRKFGNLPGMTNFHGTKKQKKSHCEGIIRAALKENFEKEHGGKFV